MFKREIHKREGNGITVTLFAHFEISTGDTVECVEISCHVIDSCNGTEFTISDIPDDKALDVFYHPFATGERLLATGVI